MKETMLNKIDGLVSIAIFSILKWSLLICFALVGAVSMYTIYSEIFTDGWGLSSLSKFEVVFLVATAVLTKRFIKKSSDAGSSLFKNLFYMTAYVGVLAIVLFALIGWVLFSTAVKGGSADDLILSLFVFDYADELTVMVVILLAIYVSAPTDLKAENDLLEKIAGVEEGLVNKDVEDIIAEPLKDSDIEEKSACINETSKGVGNA